MSKRVKAIEIRFPRISKVSVHRARIKVVGVEPPNIGLLINLRVTIENYSSQNSHCIELH